MLLVSPEIKKEKIMQLLDQEFKKNFKKAMIIAGSVSGIVTASLGYIGYRMVQNKNAFLQEGFQKSDYRTNTYFKMLDSATVEVKDLSDKDKSEIFDFKNKRIYIENGDLITSKYNPATETSVITVNDTEFTLDQYLQGNYNTPELDETDRAEKLDAVKAFKERFALKR